jgi:hypothetical protein
MPHFTFGGGKVPERMNHRLRLQLALVLLTLLCSIALVRAQGKGLPLHSVRACTVYASRQNTDLMSLTCALFFLLGTVEAFV